MYKTLNLPNTRIDVADAMRGIAVAGIILYHSVEHFDIFTKEPIVHTLPCDQTVADVLSYVQYEPKKLVRSLEIWAKQAIKEGKITLEEGKEFLDTYRSGLYGYTYLE